MDQHPNSAGIVDAWGRPVTVSTERARQASLKAVAADPYDLPWTMVGMTAMSCMVAVLWTLMMGASA